jgi:hypothetical protein
VRVPGAVVEGQEEGEEVEVGVEEGEDKEEEGGEVEVGEEVVGKEEQEGEKEEEEVGTDACVCAVVDKAAVAAGLEAGPSPRHSAMRGSSTSLPSVRAHSRAICASCAAAALIGLMSSSAPRFQARELHLLGFHSAEYKVLTVHPLSSNLQKAGIPAALLGSENTRMWSRMSSCTDAASHMAAHVVAHEQIAPMSAAMRSTNPGSDASCSIAQPTADKAVSTAM